MKFRDLLFGILLAVALCFGRLLSPAAAANVIVTAQVWCTNGTVNGNTITVNGQVRNWINVVTTPATQILTNNTANGSKTNLLAQFINYPLPALGGLTPSVMDTGTSNLSLTTPAGNGSLTVSIAGSWGYVAWSTNYLTNNWSVRIPTSNEVLAEQTNINSGLVAAIDSVNQTNAVTDTHPAWANLVGIDNNQTVTGAKTFSSGSGLWNGSVNSGSISGTVGTFTNGLYTNSTLVNPTFTNGLNYGAAISSPFTNGTAGSEQFGSNAVANSAWSTALGANSHAGATQGTAIGSGARADGSAGTALGYNANVTAASVSSMALGAGAYAAGSASTAIGNQASCSFYNNSTAVGATSTNTASSQVMLGAPGISTVVNNLLTVGGAATFQSGATFANGVTNLLHTGTNSFPSGADVSFGRYSLGTLANGNNAAVPVNTNVFVEVSGPTGAFTVNGISGSPNRDGKLLILLNRTGFNMTIAHDSGVDATAANRIYTLTAADKTVTGNSSAMLIYNGNNSRWILLYFGQ